MNLNINKNFNQNLLNFYKMNTNNKTINAINNHLSDSNDNQPLIDKVIERIKEDVNYNDFTAIDELLKFIPEQYLKGYLAED